MTAVVMNTTDSFSSLPQVQKTAVDNGRDKTDFSSMMRERLGSQQNVEQKKDTNSIAKEPVKPAKKLDNKNIKQQNISRKNDDNVKNKPDDGKNINEEAGALGVMNKVFESVADRLDISPEELSAAMNELSLSPMDLLDRNSVAQLILFLNGSDDMADMLVDNGMLEALNDITAMTADIVEESAVSEDAFAKLIAEGIPDDESAAPELKETLSNVNEHLKSLLNKNKEAAEDAESLTDAGAEEIEIVETPAINSQKAENTGAKDEGRNETGASERGVRSERRNDSQTVFMSGEEFLNGLEKTADAGEITDVQQADFRDIVNQVVERVRVSLSPDSSSMEMRLNPENLGRVSINIISRDGVMKAEIRTENEAAREAIESQLQILKESIQEKGLRVDEIEVNISDFHFADSKNSESEANGSESSNSGRGRRGNGFSLAGDAEEISEAAQNAREILENSGSTVSYRV